MNILSMRRRGAGAMKSKYLMTATSNPEVFAICVAQGWCSSEGMTYEDATNISNIGVVFRNNKDIKTFDELRYFGITTLPNNCFWGCSNLTSVKLPVGITSVGNYAFRETAITNISLPNVVTIGDYAFNKCNSLLSIEIGDKIETIGGNCIREVAALQYIKIVATTPPAIGNGNSFNSTLSIYVPDLSVSSYKSANYWSNYADKTFPLSEFVQP